MVLQNHKEATAVFIRYCSAVLSTAYILRTCPSTNESRQHSQHQRGVVCTAQTIGMGYSIRKRIKSVPKADKKAQTDETPKNSVLALRNQSSNVMRHTCGLSPIPSLSRSLHCALLLLRTTLHCTKAFELKVLIVLLLQPLLCINLLAHTPASYCDRAI